ncbi:MAG TPA: hypothetical protein VG869_06340 [Acidimicrobiia bacterium]|jgi:hypothetical protein|nr:hypothetical protein [Acidimicrobiia bacterium]
MAAHHFVSDDGDVEVRRVQPYQATKTYRCPGCDHPIGPGTGHVVVVPSGAVEDRRHWHTACWGRASRPGRRGAAGGRSART